MQADGRQPGRHIPRNATCSNGQPKNGAFDPITAGRFGHSGNIQTRGAKKIRQTDWFS
jgi:hypothetical protein